MEQAGRIAGTVVRMGDPNMRIWKYIEEGDYPAFQECLKDLHPLIISGSDHYSYSFEYSRSETSPGRWPQYTEQGSADVNLLAAVIGSSPDRNPHRRQMLLDLLQAADQRNLKSDLVNQRMGEEGMTPLMFAAQSNDAELVRVLLDNGADKTLKTIRENPATQFAPRPDIKEMLEP